VDNVIGMNPPTYILLYPLKGEILIDCMGFSGWKTISREESYVRNPIFSAPFFCIEGPAKKPFRVSKDMLPIRQAYVTKCSKAILDKNHDDFVLRIDDQIRLRIWTNASRFVTIEYSQ
jgi:hypothetical protein